MKFKERRKRAYYPKKHINRFPEKFITVNKNFKILNFRSNEDLRRMLIDNLRLGWGIF